MSFQISYEKRVFKDLDKIPYRDVAMIRDVIKALSDAPLQHGSKKLAGQSGLYRIRQGDYRIVYDIDFKKAMIRIILIRHRKEVYRRL